MDRARCTVARSGLEFDSLKSVGAEFLRSQKLGCFIQHWVLPQRCRRLRVCYLLVKPVGEGQTQAKREGE